MNTLRTNLRYSKIKEKLSLPLFCPLIVRFSELYKSEDIEFIASVIDETWGIRTVRTAILTDSPKSSYSSTFEPSSLGMPGFDGFYML